MESPCDDTEPQPPLIEEITETLRRCSDLANPGFGFPRRPSFARDDLILARLAMGIRGTINYLMIGSSIVFQEFTAQLSARPTT